MPNPSKDINTKVCADIITRRGFLGMSAGAALGLAGCSNKNGEKAMNGGSASNDILFGIITDLHYADKDTWGTRFYRDSTDKLDAAVSTFNTEKAAFAIELGDIIDKADKEIEKGYLERINASFSAFEGPRYYVFGNHDVATFSKEEFMEQCGFDKSRQSFDIGGWHFVILDACFNGDGSPYNAGNFDWQQTYIPQPELEWLASDLAASGGKRAIIFIHQILNDETDAHGVKNAPEVRSVLESAGNVHAVFQGHMHTGGYAEVNGIHYVTLRAAVEGEGFVSNAYGTVRLSQDGSIVMNGFGQQRSYELKHEQRLQ